MIKYADIVNNSVVDGIGIRVTAFLQGCPFSCKDCHNPALQPTEGGKEISERDFVELLTREITPVHKGITFSGGDPFLQGDALDEVISMIREKVPSLDVWVYTGYTFEELRYLPIIKKIDVLVDGQFECEKKDLNLAFRGSSNQRIIDVHRSLKENQIVLLALEPEIF